ncbi:MAG TPA: glycoside hydrolase family protein [Caulobacteraceae bacterium]
MKPRHQVSKAAIELIKRFEGYRRKAARLPDGRWTVGYGHTLTARETSEVSEEDAEALLLYDLIEVAHAVNEMTFAPISKHQFDALCAFVFNVGVENFRTSTVLRRLNEGGTLQAAAAMELWRKADVNGERIVIDALVRRRAAEKLLFLTPPDGWVRTSTPMLPPKLDYDAVDEFALRAAPGFDVVEDAPDPEPEPLGEPGFEAPSETASERAAAAVGAKLEQIFPEPEGPAGPVLRLTPAPEFDLDAAAPDPVEPDVKQEGPTLFDVAPPAQTVRSEALTAINPSPVQRKADGDGARGWTQGLGPLVLAAVGMALAGGSLFWSLYADGGAGGLDPRLVGMIGAPLGLLVSTFGIYLTLRRLSGADAD